MGEDTNLAPQVIILYRVAESANKNKNKAKPDWVSNIKCLQNLYNRKGDAKLIVFGDRLSERSKAKFLPYCDELRETTAHGNAETFMEIFDFALEHNPNDIIYFVEDDYIHRNGFTQIIREGLERADYVSLYDHPDKYDGKGKVLNYTASTHWKYEASTTMTFAAKVKTLAFDIEVFRQLVTTGNPPDHYIFSYLVGKNYRRLMTPIPGYATHGETQWLAPVIDWEAFAR
jgi:hypothetical protein